MTDRELLEKAAAAFWAGEIDDVCSVEWGEQDNCILYTHGDNQDHNGADRTYRWNPLEENADAFELMVKLGLIVDTRLVPTPRFDTDEVCTIAVLPRPSEKSSGEWHADSDPYAATRRAIVRAAASIGPTP